MLTAFYISPFPFGSTLARVWWQSRAAQFIAGLPDDDGRRRIAWFCTVIFSNGSRTCLIDAGDIG